MNRILVIATRTVTTMVYTSLILKALSVGVSFLENKDAELVNIHESLLNAYRAQDDLLKRKEEARKKIKRAESPGNSVESYQLLTEGRAELLRYKDLEKSLKTYITDLEAMYMSKKDGKK